MVGLDGNFLSIGNWTANSSLSICAYLDYASVKVRDAYATGHFSCM